MSLSQRSTQVENHHPNTESTQLPQKYHTKPPKSSDKAPSVTANAIPVHRSAIQCGKLDTNVINPFFRGRESTTRRPCDGFRGRHPPPSHPIPLHPPFPPTFEVVRSYTYVKWASKDGREEWNNYSNSHKRLDVEWQPVVSTLRSQRRIDETMAEKSKPKTIKRYKDLPVHIPPIHHSKIKLACKKNNCHVDGLKSIFRRRSGDFSSLISILEACSKP